MGPPTCTGRYMCARTHPSDRRVRPTTRGDTIHDTHLSDLDDAGRRQHHLERFAALDLQGVVADYAPDAVMIVPTGVLRGVHEITPLFQNLLAEFAKPGATFNLQQQVIEGDVAYIWWVAVTLDNTYELGTDTFFVQHGKIAVQTFAFKATPRA
jgi:ketosteroid isomerase-like protein